MPAAYETPARLGMDSWLAAVAVHSCAFEMSEWHSDNSQRHENSPGRGGPRAGRVQLITLLPARVRTHGYAARVDPLSQPQVQQEPGDPGVDPGQRHRAARDRISQ